MRAQHHFDRGRFTPVSYGFPAFRFDKDVVNALGFDTVVILKCV